MNQRKTLLTISFIVLTSLLLTGIFGCAPKAVEPAPTPVKPIELTYAHWVPPTSPFVKYHIQPWIEMVEQQSGGRIKITEQGAGALGGAAEHYDLAVKGIADISFAAVGFTPGRFLLSEGLAVPMTFPDAAITNDVVKALFKPYLAKEFGQVKPLGMGIGLDALLYNGPRTKQVQTLEDLKGLKVRTLGGLMTPGLEALGAIPVNVPLPDVYLAMERGVIDAGSTDVAMATSFKLAEVTSSTLDFGFGRGIVVIAMNLDSYNRLPADLQALLDRLGDEIPALNARANDAPTAAAYEKLRAAGPVEALAPQELERWSKVLQPVVAEWIQELEGKGIAAREFFNAFRDESIKRGVKFIYPAY
ncbi:MAG: TRAP transporter substrate-binding protein [Dehalococcoidia bacterium]